MACCFLECSFVIPYEKYKVGEEEEQELIATENNVHGQVYKCRLSFGNVWRGFCKLGKGIPNMWRSKKFVKCRKLTFIILLALLILTFLAAFVIFPLVFMSSYEMQKDMLYHPKKDQHSSFEYDLCLNNDRYPYGRINCGINTILPINSTGNNLGVWYFSIKCNTSDNCELFNDTKPLLIFFHEQEGNRKTKKNIDLYVKLLETFQIITFDYRGYGDSTVDDLNEQGIIEDSVQLYKWIQSNTALDIYLMGDKLGASIAAHVVSKVPSQNIPPVGVILINPWYSLTYEIKRWVWPFYQMCSWMPWFKGTFLGPMANNGLTYATYQYLNDVDSPILIFRVEDWYHNYGDVQKLYDYILDNRKIMQGGVEYKKMWSYSDSDFDNSIRDFIQVCRRFHEPGNNITNYFPTSSRYHGRAK